MSNKTQQTTKYAGVFKDLKSGHYFYQTELGTDRVTGKRVRKKARKDSTGKPFLTASEANKELTRIKREYHKVNSYANYKMTYKEFMDNVYIPFYKTDVEESTFKVRKKTLELIRDRFETKELRQITAEDVQYYRTYLLSSTDDNGAGYSQSYASLVFGMFRKSLDKAVEMQYLEYNISKRIKAIPKGKTNVPYWKKTEFEQVIAQIYIDDFYEHLNFVMLWVYYMTGVRVNEGMALWWEDVDFDKKRMSIHHMLDIESKTNYTRKSYTKTASGKRTIALDNDTISVLKKWKERQKSIGLGQENDFIFSYDGAPMIKSTLARIIERYSKLAGVKKIQGKGLRHSHTSYLINEFSASVLIISKRLGHSSPDITLKHYAHMWSNADEAIAEVMAGNIKIKTADKSNITFIGNQSITKALKDGAPPSTPPKLFSSI